jgi:hypothetical protein
MPKQDAAAAVRKELTEMKKLGMRVPQKAFEVADLEAAGLQGMKVSEMADYCISIADLCADDIMQSWVDNPRPVKLTELARRKRRK